MSGHSKWSTIKRKKGALDAKRGKIFTKLIREITISAREGGTDPEGNPRLRLAISNAKGANMPKDNITRALKKVDGGEGNSYNELTYEGYGQFGVAVYVECMTENLNRTVAAVRSIFNKYEGNLGTNGSLEFIFDRKGVFTFAVPAGMDEEELMFELIDAGAEDVESEEGYMTVFCVLSDFGSMQKKLEELAIECEVAELQRLPKTLVSLTDEQLVKAWKLIDALEDNDDVQKVYHNMGIEDSQFDLIS